MEDFYQALAYQMPCRSVSGAANPRAIMRAQLHLLEERLGAAKSFIGKDLKLICLPEYFLTGYPQGESIQQWTHHAALDCEGPEYAHLGKIARDLEIHLCGNAYETDPHFKDLYFQTSFIIAPDGKIILRYRRLHSLYSPTPYDFLDKYLDIYGYDALFPVVETEIGCLAAVASEEILFPELARILSFKGAEILLHSTSEIARTDLCPKAVCAQARAIENMVYVLSANSGGLYDSAMAPNSTDGGSRIIDFSGRVLSQAGTGDSMAAYGTIHLSALRQAKQRPAMDNLYARQKPALFARAYEQAPSYPANLFLEDDQPTIPDRAQFNEMLKAHIAQMMKQQKKP